MVRKGGSGNLGSPWRHFPQLHRLCLGGGGRVGTAGQDKGARAVLALLFLSSVQLK